MKLVLQRPLEFGSLQNQANQYSDLGSKNVIETDKKSLFKIEATVAQLMYSFTTILK